MKLINTLLTNIKKRKWLLLAVVILITIGWRWKTKVDNNQPQLTFEKPIHRDLEQTLEISGIIDAQEKASLRFAAGGKVVFIGAQEGDWIKKWQTLATIDRRDLQKRLQKDLNLYMKERWDWDQQLDDIKDRTIDKREERTVDKNQWDLDNTVLDVEIRDIAIRDTSIYAPIEGVLVESPTTVAGVQLLATDSFEIVNPNTLIFKALVDESDVALIKPGQRTTIILDSYVDEKIVTNVDYISYKSTETSGGTSFIVKFNLKSAESLDHYRLGMNGDAKILLSNKDNTLSLPIEAVRQRDEKHYVDIKTTENSYEEREIKIGMETDDYMEIISGINENDEILILD